MLRAIRQDVAELIVTPLSGRPLVTAAAVAPAVGMALMRGTGLVGMFRQMAEEAAAQWTGNFNPRLVDGESLKELYACAVSNDATQPQCTSYRSAGEMRATEQEIDD